MCQRSPPCFDPSQVWQICREETFLGCTSWWRPWSLWCCDLWCEVLLAELLYWSSGCHLMGKPECSLRCTVMWWKWDKGRRRRTFCEYVEASWLLHVKKQHGSLGYYMLLGFFTCYRDDFSCSHRQLYCPCELICSWMTVCRLRFYSGSTSLKGKSVLV